MQPITWRFICVVRPVRAGVSERSGAVASDAPRSAPTGTQQRPDPARPRRRSYTNSRRSPRSARPSGCPLRPNRSASPRRYRCRPFQARRPWLPRIRRSYRTIPPSRARRRCPIRLRHRCCFPRCPSSRRSRLRHRCCFRRCRQCLSSRRCRQIPRCFRPLPRRDRRWPSSRPRHPPSPPGAGAAATGRAAGAALPARSGTTRCRRSRTAGAATPVSLSNATPSNGTTMTLLPWFEPAGDLVVLVDVGHGEGHVGDEPVLDEDARPLHLVPVVDGAVGVAEDLLRVSRIVGQSLVGPVVDAVGRGQVIADAIARIVVEHVVLPTAEPDHRIFGDACRWTRRSTAPSDRSASVCWDRCWRCTGREWPRSTDRCSWVAAPCTDHRSRWC